MMTQYKEVLWQVRWQASEAEPVASDAYRGQFDIVILFVYEEKEGQVL